MTVLEETTETFKEGGYVSADELDESPAHENKCRKLSTTRELNDAGYSSSVEDDASTCSTSDKVSTADSQHGTETKSETVIDLTLVDEKQEIIPDSIKYLLSARLIGLPDEYQVPVDKVPDWFDHKKYSLGRQFGQKYYFGVTYSEMLSLYLLFMPEKALLPLIFTGNSHTPFKAFKRYLSTSSRVKTWVDCDIWNSDSLGYKNLRTVRAMHLNASKKIDSTPLSEVKRLGTMIGPMGNEGIWCPMYKGIKSDLATACPYAKINSKENGLTDEEEPGSYFNQSYMSLTQFGFVGLILLYPEKFGASTATEEELEGFAHLWRCIGYLLGIEDEYNFCKGSLPEVRQRCSDVIDYIYKPNLHNLTADWEHMSRCMVEGISYYIPGVSFEVSFSYLCWVLGLQVPSVTSSFSLYQSCMFYLTKFFMVYSSRIPAILRMHNYFLKQLLEKVHKQPKEWYDKIESKKYDYQKKKFTDSYIPQCEEVITSP